MSRKSLVIEINERIIRICEIQPKDRAYSVVRSVVAAVPDGLVNDGILNDPEMLGGLIRTTLDENRITAKNAVFSVMSGRVAMREITIPDVKERRIKSVIDTNAAEYFPVDLSGYQLGYSVLEKLDGDSGKRLRVMAYAVPLQVLEGYFKAAAAAELQVQAVDYVGNSQYNALRSVGSDQVTMHVCVDNTYTYITFLVNGMFAMQRTLTFGGDEFVGDYLQVTGRDRGSYLAAVEELSGRDGERRASDAMQDRDPADSLERLVSGINRSLGYYNANNYANAVSKIVLSGFCGKLAFLKGAVREMTNLPTSHLQDEPDAAKVFANPAEGSLAVNSIGACIAPLDIMPAQFVTQRKSKSESGDAKQSLTVGFVVLGLLVVIAGVLFFSSWNDRKLALEAKTAAETEIADLEYVEDIYFNYRNYKTSADAITEVRISNESPNDQLVAFFEELEQKMPSELILLSATCTKTSVTLNITVPSKEDMAAVLVQLRTFLSLQNIRVASMLESVDEAGGGYVSFTALCEYGPNPYFGETGEEVTE